MDSTVIAAIISSISIVLVAFFTYHQNRKLNRALSEKAEEEADRAASEKWGKQVESALGLVAALQQEIQTNKESLRQEIQTYKLRMKEDRAYYDDLMKRERENRRRNDARLREQIEIWKAYITEVVEIAKLYQTQIIELGGKPAKELPDPPDIEDSNPNIS